LYPILEIFDFKLYSFWITLLLCFVAFFYIMRKLSKKYSFDRAIFINPILLYFISMFFFSRLFHIISKWYDFRFIENSVQFFVSTDYDFSLFWALFGFFIILFINLRIKWEKLIKYIDSILLSFLLLLSIWSIWALLWWQIYWTPTNFWIELTYNKFSSTPLFPLAIVYFLFFFLEFAILYILSMYIKIKWFIWYIWFLFFSLTILVFENFSWKHDIFDNYIFINMNQVLAILLMIFSFYRLYILSKISSKDTTIIIEHK